MHASYAVAPHLPLGSISNLPLKHASGTGVSKQLTTSPDPPPLLHCVTGMHGSGTPAKQSTAQRSRGKGRALPVLSPDNSSSRSKKSRSSVSWPCVALDFLIAIKRGAIKRGAHVAVWLIARGNCSIDSDLSYLPRPVPGLCCAEVTAVSSQG